MKSRRSALRPDGYGSQTGYQCNLLFEFNRGIGGCGINQRAVSRGAGNFRSWTIVVRSAVSRCSILLCQVETSEQACADCYCIVSSSCQKKIEGWSLHIPLLSSGAGAATARPDRAARMTDKDRRAMTDNKRHRRRRSFCC